MVPGVGSLEPNEGGNGQDEEPAETKDEAWKQLLTDDSPPSLKPWSTAGNTTKANLGHALREYMRQAWGKVSFCYCFSDLIPIYLEDSGRRGKITWEKLGKNPQSLIAPKFLLDIKLQNPPRMPLNSIHMYWNYWVLQHKRGDPFSFIHVNGGDQDMGNGGNDQSDEEVEDPALHFTIDDGVLPPISSCGTSKNRTRCLQALVTDKSGDSKTFRTTVKLVNTLEVSYI